MYALDRGILQGWVNYVAYDEERERLSLLIGRRRDKQVDGEWEKGYETIPISFFGKLANTYADFDLDKKHVTIEYRLAPREIDDNIVVFVNGTQLHVSPAVSNDSDESRPRKSSNKKNTSSNRRVQSADDDLPPWEKD